MVTIYKRIKCYSHLLVGRFRALYELLKSLKAELQPRLNMYFRGRIDRDKHQGPTLSMALTEVTETTKYISKAA
jgi:hypothetical protein